MVPADMKKQKDPAARMYKRSMLLMRYGCSIASVFLCAFLLACGAQKSETIPPADTAFSLAATEASEQGTLPSASFAPAPKESAEQTPEPSATVSFVDRVVCTADEFVHIRERSGTDAGIAGIFPAGENAGVIEYADGWALLSYRGLTGYVSRDYIVSQSAPEGLVPTGEFAAILVNPTHALPEDFKVSLADFEGGQVDTRILDVSEQMFADAKADGISFQLVDAYRSYDRQNELFRQKVESYTAQGMSPGEAEDKAATITARPDTSEHQTGLALDIVTSSYAIMDSGFADTKAYKWLAANAQNYGFTMRYGQDKSSVTKVIYEPWHWRFVGVEAATEMKQSGMCLEEYLGVMD